MSFDFLKSRVLLDTLSDIIPNWLKLLLCCSRLLPDDVLGCFLFIEATVNEKCDSRVLVREVNNCQLNDTKTVRKVPTSETA